MCSTKSISRATSTTIRATTATSTRTTTPKRPADRRIAAALGATALWALFAFGGAYPWTSVPIIIASAGLAMAVRPRVAGRGTSTLDIALCACLALAALQAVPLPQAVRSTVAPSVAQVDRALYLPDNNPSARAFAPLSVDPDATIRSTLLAAAIVLLFWCARATFDGASERRTVRLIAIAGLIASATAIVQHATAPGLLYWTWRPIDPGARPYSPFVNRNDFAGWLILAIPLTVGYLVARIESRRELGIRRAVAESLDATGVWLAGAVCVMSGALVAFVSRSGLIAGLGAIAVFGLLARARLATLEIPTRRRLSRTGVIAGLGLVGLGATAFFNAEAVSPRLADALSNGVGSRREIWTLTMAIIRDFWQAGVGVGAYARAMSTYQPPHDFAFNHAHNEYLQVVAEGGVALAAGVAVVVAAGSAQAARRLHADRTAMSWIRIGAVSGMAATAIQSVWETAIRMPANAVLFALCAAMALGPTSSGRTPGEPLSSGRRG